MKRAGIAVRSSPRDFSGRVALAVAVASTARVLSDTPGSEDSATLSGELKRVVISDPEAGITATTFLRTRGRRWIEIVMDEVPEAAVNRNVQLLGKWARCRFRVQDIVIADEGAGELEQTLITPTPKRIAVLLLNFRNDTTQPRDIASTRDMVFTGATSVNAYFKEISFGARSLIGKNSPDGDVYGWYTLDVDNTPCNYSAWGTEARAKATAAGVDLNGYDHIIHYFPRASSCSFSGVAQMPGRYSWISGSGAQTTAHEVGHNFGVHHASTYVCTLNGARVSVGGTCTLDEYGDPFDVMGRGYRHMNAYQKGKLGFLEPQNTVTSSSGDFTVVPLATKSDGIQALRVPIAGTSEFYYVEKRNVFGFDSFRTTDPVVNGVLIHRATDYPTRVRRLWSTPCRAPRLHGRGAHVGRTFTDPAATCRSRSLHSPRPAPAYASARGGSGGAGGSGGPWLGGAGGSGGSAGGGNGWLGRLDGRDLSCRPDLLRRALLRVLGRAGVQLRGVGVAVRHGRPGYQLVRIDSAAENQFVSSLVGATETWIGADDRTTEGTWTWFGGGSRSGPAERRAARRPARTRTSRAASPTIRRLRAYDRRRDVARRGLYVAVQHPLREVRADPRAANRRRCGDAAPLFFVGWPVAEPAERLVKVLRPRPLCDACSRCTQRGHRTQSDPRMHATFRPIPSARLNALALRSSRVLLAITAITYPAFGFLARRGGFQEDIRLRLPIVAVVLLLWRVATYRQTYARAYVGGWSGSCT